MVQKRRALVKIKKLWNWCVRKIIKPKWSWLMVVLETVTQNWKKILQTLQERRVKVGEEKVANHQPTFPSSYNHMLTIVTLPQISTSKEQSVSPSLFVLCIKFISVNGHNWAQMMVYPFGTKTAKVLNTTSWWDTSKSVQVNHICFCTSYIFR